MDSLRELSSKGQRTVYRLTLVKGWNAEEMDNYAKLVDIGKPDFIEVKGVTYCGTSKGEMIVMLVKFCPQIMFGGYFMQNNYVGYLLFSLVTT